jgi:hypothetical protein
VSWSPTTEIVSPIQNDRKLGVCNNDGTNRRRPTTRKMILSRR